MKQTVQQQKRKAPAPAMQKPRKTTRLRPGIVNQSNHSRLANDKWERQADDAATRIIKGEQCVARRLTPSPTASKKVTSSRGEHLQPLLRERLETGFGADLGSVRIHNDAAAWSSSSQENARAFTSGSHIYFAANTYAPDSNAGFALLAHEISHTLQQTGRPSFDGTPKVTDISGSGEIQREWNFNSFISDYLEHANLPTDRQAEVLPLQEDSRDSFLRIENEIRQVIGLNFSLTADQGSSTKAIELEQLVVEGEFDNETAEAKSLLFDVLKIWQRNEGAAHLIHHDADIETRYYPDDTFLDFFRDAEHFGTGSIRNLLESEHTDYQNVWPYNLTTQLWHYLTQTEFNLRVPTQGYPSSEESVWEEYRSRGDNFISNELVLLAKDTMFRADQLLHDNVDRALDESNDTSDSSDWGMKNITQRVLLELQESEPGEGTLIRQIRRRLRAIATSADNYWERVLSLRSEIEADLGPRRRALLLARGESAQLPYPEFEFPDEALLTELIEVVVRQTRGLFFLPDDSYEPGVLPQEQYETAIAGYLEEIEPFSARISELIGTIFVYGNRNDPRLVSRTTWLGWAQVWLLYLKNILELYNAEQDRAATNDDARRRHRLYLVPYLQQLGAASNNEFLISVAESVLSGSDIGRSYILLSDGWEHTDHDVNHLVTDFPGGLHIGNWGVTVHQLVIFYHLLYQSEIVEQLIATFHSSPDAQADDAEHLQSIRELRQNFNAVMNSPELQELFPKRYINQHAIINYYAGDELGLNDLLIKRVDGDADRYESQEFARFVEQYAGGEAGQILTPLRRATRLYLWVMPPFQALFDTLSQIHLLNNLVVESSTNPRAWMIALGEAIEQMSEDEQQDFSSDLSEAQSQQANIALSWRRRNFTEEVRSRLIIATRHRGEIEHYSDMTDAYDIIRDLSFRIRPREFVEPQMTAMMLDLADELHAALLDEPSWLEDLLGIGTRVDTRYDVLTSYYGLIDHALEFLSEENARSRLSSIIVAHVLPNSGEAPEQRAIREEQARRSRISALLAKQSVLQGIKDQLSESIVQIQLGGIGFEVRSEGVKSFNYASTLPLMEEMHYQGSVYILDAVFEDFNYFPPYAPDTDAGHPSILIMVSGSEQTRDDREGSTRLLRYIVDGQEHVVTSHSRDDHHLEMLARVIEEAAFVRSLENLADVIEGATELTMDVLELVPGFGQGLMIARMGAEITRFIVDDLPDLREALNNPEAMFQELQDWFDEGDWLENMLEYLLFEASSITLPASLTSNTDDNNHSRRRRHGSLDRIIHAMKTLGEKVLYAFQLLQRNVRAGMVRAQLRLIEYRTLMRIIELIPGLALTATTTVAMARQAAQEHADLLLTPAQMLGQLANEEGSIESKIQETFTHVVEGLNSLDLPENIVPMEAFVDVLMGFAFDRFGRKGKVLNDFLQAVGARQALADRITEHLVEGTNIDINQHWRNHFREPLRQKLISMQEYIINDAVNPIIRETLGAQYIVDMSQIGQPDVGNSTSEEPEVERYSRDSEDEELERSGFSLPIGSRGKPLSRQQRVILESQFGHSLGHVRLHSDEQSDDITGAAGAFALTSGSHVFLSSDINLAGDKGQHILRHEIAHVLQQTGNRPLSEQHDDQPSMGRPGRGLRHDPSREAAAERMARQAQKAGEPVRIEEEGGEGFYASPRIFVLKMFNYLSDSQLSEQVASDMEDAIPRMTGEERTSFNSAKSEARALWRSVNTQLRTADSGDFDRPFFEGKSLINAAMNTAYGNAGEVIDALTFRSVRQRSNGQYRLKPVKFLEQLRTYIYGKTGIVLRIHEASDRVTRVQVTYIHLGNTETNYSIWSDGSGGVKHNTETAASAEQNEVINRNWPRIREYIRSLQYETREVWHDTQFRLSNAFIDEVAEHFREVSEDDVEIGIWAQYTTPTLAGNEHRIGLRVATHGQLTGRASSTPPPAPEGENSTVGPNIDQAAKVGRESHHIPQYLLVEYFRNEASTSLFDSSNPLPGFESSGGRVTEFSGGSSQQIQLDKLDPGGQSNRGLNLPAVSIAARTHQRGQLHVNQSSEWSMGKEITNPDTGTLTQSLWLDFYFYNQLDNESRGAGGRAASGKDAIIERVRGMEPAAAKGAVYRAMKASYQEMYGNMIDIFEPALGRHEIGYYRDLAMARPNQTMRNGQLESDYTPDTAALGAVTTAVAGLNDRIMHQWK